MFLTYRIRDFHGISGTSNFTWGRALGTGTTSQATSSNTALDVFNLENNYGPQSYDIKFLYNLGPLLFAQVVQHPEGSVGPCARRLDLLAAVDRAERQPADRRLHR